MTRTKPKEVEVGQTWYNFFTGYMCTVVEVEKDDVAMMAFGQKVAVIFASERTMIAAFSWKFVG